MCGEACEPTSDGLCAHTFSSEATLKTSISRCRCRFSSKSVWDLRASGDLDYSRQAVWSDSKFIIRSFITFKNKFPAVLAVQVNSTALFCREAPEMFCRAAKLHMDILKKSSEKLKSQKLDRLMNRRNVCRSL